MNKVWKDSKEVSVSDIKYDPKLKEALARAIMQQAILKIENLKDLKQPPPERDAE